MRRLFAILDRGGRRELTLMAALALVNVCFELGFIGLFVEFMTALQRPDELAGSARLSGQVFRWLGQPRTSDFFLGFGAVVIIVLVLNKIGGMLASWAGKRFVWTQESRLSALYLDHYLRLPYEKLLQIHGSEIAREVMAARLNWGVLTPLLMLLNQGSVAVVLSLGLLLVEPTLALVSGFVLALSYGLLQLMSSRLQSRLGEATYENERGKQKVFSECLQGLLPIVVGGHQDYFLSRFRRHTTESSRSVSQQAVTTELPRFFLEGVALSGIVALSLLIALGGWGSEQLVPLLSLYALAAFRLLPAYHECYCAVTALKFHHQTLDQYFKVVDSRQETDSTSVGRELTLNDAISLAGVAYRYPERELPALSGIDLLIAKGSSLGIVGRSGAGKSTLVNVLLGLLSPTQGEVQFDGNGVSAAELKVWRRRQVGYVPQETFLLGDTVNRNVAFGLEDHEIDQQAVERACRAAGIHDFIIEELPHGYQTDLGERGLRLSGGQRQRLGIARALYHNPEVLILDEATSALDKQTEAEVMDAVRHLRGKTLILISHRLALTAECDRICLLQEGKLVDHGSHAELKQNTPAFKQLLSP